MPKDRDTEEIKAICRQYHLAERQRRLFSKFIHQEKEMGYGGTKNSRGDFTWLELKEKMQEFRELYF